MKPQQVIDTVCRHYKAHVKTLNRKRHFPPLYVHGSPGVGKSDCIREAAEQLSRENGTPVDVLDIRALLLDPTEVKGFPFIDKNSATFKYAVPDFWPTAGNWIIFLDELSAAPPLVQAAFYQLTLDRKILQYTLPPNAFIVAAGNKETDRAVVHRLSTALATRFVHCTFETDLDQWCQWAIANDVRTDVIAFNRLRPELHFSFDPKRHTEKAFPCPRTWTFLSDVMDTDPPKDQALELCSGTVGEGAAVEYLAFLDMMNKLPSLDSIIMNPKKADVPKEPALKYAISTGLARKASAKNIGRIIEYLERMPEEFNVLSMRDTLAQSPELANTREYIKWTSAHSDALI